MSEDARRTWSADWAARLPSRLLELGFEEIELFLAAFPGESYVQLAKRLGEASAAQLVQLHLASAMRRGQLRAFAMETLARGVAEEFPEGWGTGENVDFRRSGVVANWLTNFSLISASSETEQRLRASWRAIKATAPLGWRPMDGQDPVISAAFAAEWPRA